MCNFRTLRADEIECRVSKIGDGWVTCLLYKTARTDMDLLDETVGAMNWRVMYDEIKGNLFCTISIKDKETGSWITKQNCGIESRPDDGNEKKGEASDAMKRAGFCWGIGRELYSAPFIMIYCKTRDDKGNKINHYFDVAEIGYNAKRRINKLVLTEKGNEVFRFDETKPEETPETSEAVLRAQILVLAKNDLERLNAFINAFFATETPLTLDDLHGGELVQLKQELARRAKK